VTLATIFLLVSVAQGVSGYIAALFSSDLLRRLQTSFFAKTAHLPLDYFRHNSSGEFFTRFNHDVGQAQSFVANVLPTFVREAVTACALIVILVWSSPALLVGTAIVITGASAALAIWCRRILEKFAVKQRAGWSEINRQFDETIRGIDTIKTFGAEERRGEVFDRQTSYFRSLSENAGKTSALFSPAIDLFARLGSLILVIIAYQMIAGEQLSVDTFLLFFFCSALLQGSTSSMINLYMQMPPQLVGIQNLSHFFLEKEDTFEHRNGQEVGSAKIHRALPIEFHNLYFAYPDSPELYNGAHLTIPANSITVIKGPNGCGKSTLINLLLKFNTPQKGTILIGGKSLSEYSRKELRTKISVVTQYHHIFHDTVRENLLIARPDATDTELLDALEKVGMTAFLKRLPHGLNQILDSTGKSISGGERQRMCLARLLLRRSPVLLLDEPWSHLDGASARVLANLLNQLREYSTLVVISHQRDKYQLKYENELVLGHDIELRSDPHVSAESCHNVLNFGVTARSGDN
jgi:ATP-binding cassette subfamily B protein